MSLVDPTLDPAERVAIALFTERVAEGMLGDGEHLARASEQWRTEDAGVKADLVALARQILRVAAVEPGLLRWCDWPGCLASYDASTGPTERGWRGKHSFLLCPDHSELGHLGWYEFDRKLTTLTATCSCGESGEVQPQNQAAVMDWWRAHVRQVAP